MKALVEGAVALEEPADVSPAIIGIGEIGGLLGRRDHAEFPTHFQVSGFDPANPAVLPSALLAGKPRVLLRADDGALGRLDQEPFRMSIEDSLHGRGRPPALFAGGILGRRQDLVARLEIRRRRPGKIVSEDGGFGGHGIITGLPGVRAAAGGNHGGGVEVGVGGGPVDPLGFPVEMPDWIVLVEFFLRPRPAKRPGKRVESLLAVLH